LSTVASFFSSHYFGPHFFPVDLFLSALVIILLTSYLKFTLNNYFGNIACLSFYTIAFVHHPNCNSMLVLALMYPG